MTARTSAYARQWHEIGQAMAAQVDRVNERAASSAAAADDRAIIRELRAENQRLLDQLADAQALIDDLKAQFDDAPVFIPSPQRGEGSGVGFSPPSPSGRGVRGEGIPRRMVDSATGRPIGTQTAYARLHNVKPYTVSRYVKAGKLAGIGRYIYLDQPLPVSMKGK